MNKKVLIIGISGAVLVFLALIGGGFYIMWSKLSNVDGAGGAGGAGGGQAPQHAEVNEELGPIIPLTTFVVNLADPGGRTYLKLTINLELDAIAAGAADEVTRRMPQIQDIILTLLPTKKSEDIQSIEGKQSLRSEMMEQINSLLRQGKVKAIYFSDFVIQ